MPNTTITHPQSYTVPARSSYHHRNVPAALRGAAREALESSNPEEIGLRELSRRVGISATAAYRHFASRDDLMATVAIEGFQELTTALQSAVDGADRAVAVGLAYLDFALSRRGLFRLMFGPLLAQRRRYPSLHAAAAAAFGVIERAGLVDEEPEDHRNSGAMAAWGLIHGLSALLIENVIPAPDVRRLAHEILANATRERARKAATESLRLASDGPPLG